ncbi:MAG: shikimate dehydrogenase [Methylophilus sp.]|nr:shikimate dehydrogenase [Methylophilus sp.]
MTDKYAVIGNPIEHSKSPLIHQAFAQQTGKDISYERMLAPLDGFEATIQTLVSHGFKGANVTVPFKFEAYQLANRHTQRSTDARAANTLIFNEGEIAADNTDGAGLVRDIEQNLHFDIRGKRVLLIGAGGAAEGVAHPIAKENPAQLVVTNRNLEKAVAIVRKLELKGEYSRTLFATFSFEDLREHAFDIVINATSTGLSETALPIPDAIFAKDCLAYDMMYGRETPFMALARAAGAQVADGLGMLVEQAAEAFFVWHGTKPETRRVIEMLRNQSLGQ